VNHATSHQPNAKHADPEWWRSAYSMADCRHLDFIHKDLEPRALEPRAGDCDKQKLSKDDEPERPARTQREVLEELGLSAEPKLSELQQAAEKLSIHADLLDSALDDSDPVKTFKELIFTAVPDRTERRRELCGLRLSALRKLALAHNVEKTQLSQALDASDAKTRREAVVKLIEEKNPLLSNTQDGQNPTAGVTTSIRENSRTDKHEFMDKHIEYCMLETLIDTVKNEHGSGSRQHWGGEDRRAKLVFIYMDRQALGLIIGTVLSVMLPAVISALSSIFKYDTEQAALEHLNQYCPSHHGNTTEVQTWELANRSACIAEQIFSNLVGNEGEFEVGLSSHV
jgi:hypothetical protein